MKSPTRNRWTLMCAMLVLLAPGYAWAQGARLQLDNLSRLSAQATDVTDISLDPSLLQLAGNFLSAKDEQTAAVKQLITGLNGVYVKSFEFDRDGAYSTADVETIRKQLTGRWTRLVFTESKKSQELVEIYSWRDGDRSGGLAILVAEPRELTVVNIVGTIDLAKLAVLQGQFGIPNLSLK